MIIESMWTGCYATDRRAGERNLSIFFKKGAYRKLTKIFQMAFTVSSHFFSKWRSKEAVKKFRNGAHRGSCKNFAKWRSLEDVKNLAVTCKNYRLHGDWLVKHRMVGRVSGSGKFFSKLLSPEAVNIFQNGVHRKLSNFYKFELTAEFVKNFQNVALRKLSKI